MLAVGLLLWPLPVHAGGYCGTSYCAPVYASYAPVYSTPCYSYHCAGWWHGRYYPAGNYAWLNGCWDLQGYGPHYGLAYGPGYDSSCDYQPSFIRFAAVLPLVDLPTYSAQYAPAVGAQAVTPGTVGSATAAAASASYQQQQSQTTAPAALPPNTMAADITEMKSLLKIVADGHQRSAVRLDRIERRLDVLEVGGKVAPQPAPLPERGDNPPPTPPQEEPKPQASAADQAVFMNRCASCHSDDNKLAKDAPILMDREHRIVPQMGPALADLEKVLTEHTMPPKKTGVVLTEEETAAIRRLFGIQPKGKQT